MVTNPTDPGRLGSPPRRSHARTAWSVVATRAVLASLLPWLVVPSGGCAPKDGASPVRMARLPDPLTEVPPDFEVEIRVMVGDRVTDRTLLQRRRVSMLLLPDGSLHAATGRFVLPGLRPGLARTLYQEQVAEVWKLVESLGLLERGEIPERPVRPPGRKEIVRVVELTSDNVRRRVVERVVAADSDPAVTELIRTMGQLAWLRDAPPPANLIEPLRYDFGPDPWARYRATNRSAESEQ
ncbi:MAG: hypothetical protein VX403_03850 [Planctomycetota bacterium]|nr:hypothetical protein [Planctomycetota bacterium]MEC9233021.1 hypothetical protein [Planctomycetota bacterium]